LPVITDGILKNWYFLREDFSYISCFW